MNKFFLLLITSLLSACGDGEEVYIMKNRHIADQCMRVKLFENCMKSLPAGPVATAYNDWDEVVSECNRISFYSSMRNREFIKPECQGE